MKEAQLERLRQSRDKHYEKSRAEGIKIGKEWALDCADFEDLERIEELDRRMVNGMKPNSMDLYEALEMNYELEGIFGIDNPSDEAIEGFIEGVVEIKNAI